MSRKINTGHKISKMHEFSIKKFRPEYLENIMEIEKQAYPKSSYSRQTIIEFAENLPDTFLVADNGRDIAGYIIFDSGGHIYSTAVKEYFRGKGFGRMLFACALKSCRNNLRLEVRSRNSGAIAFYKRMGMKIAGIIPNYYWGDDALLMVMDREG